MSGSSARLVALLLLAGTVTRVDAEVVINEILQNPSMVIDTNGEWFELFNPGAVPVDIDGWTIQDADFEVHVINNGGPR